MAYQNFVTAILAGAVVGLFAAVLHFVFIQDLIVEGEFYETGQKIHFAGVSGGDANYLHADGATDTHSEEGAEASVLTRNGLTVLFTIFTWSGFALVLFGLMQVANHYGRLINEPSGILWGISGFATVMIAPTLGLAPELPGTVAGDLGARQLWWIITAFATAIAIAIAAFARTSWLIAAIALVVMPHIIGAPQVPEPSGVSPPELASEFAARTIGASFLTWTLLGWLLGRISAGREYHKT